VSCSTQGGYIAVFTLDADMSGFSNAPCSLSIDNGNASVLDIATPTPPVSDVPSDTRQPLGASCNGDDAAVGSDVAVSTMTSTASLMATRSSTRLCVELSGQPVLNLGFSAAQERNDCPVTVTLTCSGTVLYDHIAWSSCGYGG
jgi:hypothetical protein